MHFTVLCSQFHYFASRSLKLTAFSFCCAEYSGFDLLAEGDAVMRIMFLHFIGPTCDSGERNTEM